MWHQLVLGFIDPSSACHLTQQNLTPFPLSSTAEVSSPQTPAHCPRGPAAHVRGLTPMRTPPITTGKSGDALFFLTLNKSDLTHLPFPLPWGCPSSPHLPLVLAMLCCYPGRLPSCLIGKRQPYELSLPGMGSAQKSKLICHCSLKHIQGDQDSTCASHAPELSQCGSFQYMLCLQPWGMGRSFLSIREMQGGSPGSMSCDLMSCVSLCTSSHYLRRSSWSGFNTQSCYWGSVLFFSPHHTTNKALSFLLDIISQNLSYPGEEGRNDFAAVRPWEQWLQSPRHAWKSSLMPRLKCIALHSTSNRSLRHCIGSFY